jgi:hypothetical protein
VTWRILHPASVGTSRPADAPPKEFTTEVVNVAIERLRPHDRNYRRHNEAQVKELMASLGTFGFYRPIVCSSDLVILAGHGVVQAARERGDTEVPVFVTDFSSADPKAEKLLVADNTLPSMAEDDTQAFASLLADIQRTEGLSGTGMDDAGLDALVASLAAKDVQLPDPNPEAAGLLRGEVMVTLYCSAVTLATIRPELEEWRDGLGVTLEIS